MKRELFDIWEENNNGKTYPWCVQLVNYIGHFPSRQKAESFVATTVAYRNREKKETKK
jgi:hypothetical protein